MRHVCVPAALALKAMAGACFACRGLEVSESVEGVQRFKGLGLKVLSSPVPSHARGQEPKAREMPDDSRSLAHKSDTMWSSMRFAGPVVTWAHTIHECGMEAKLFDEQRIHGLLYAR